MYLEQRKMQMATVLDCYGKFQEDDNEQFMEAIEALQSDGCQQLVLNLSSVYCLDANIFNLLMFAHEFYSNSGNQLSLVTPLSAVRRELEEAEIPKKIPTYLTVYDALHRQKAVVDKTPLHQQTGALDDPGETQIILRSDDSGEEMEIPQAELAGAGARGILPEEERTPGI